MTQAPTNFAETSSSRAAQVLGALVAVGLHGAVLALALNCEPTLASAALSVTEVDLMPLEPTAPAPEPEKAPEPTPEPEKEPAPHVRHAPAPSREPPPPAAAGALHTAREDTPDPSEPVRFAVDANGSGYGFGVVAQGGKASAHAGGIGTGPAAPAPNPTPRVAERPRAFAVPPRLDESDPCRGFFPANASVDRGEVTVLLRIAADGAVQRVTVQHEEPREQGFGASAMRCLKAKRFVPARDENDLAVIAEAPVTVRFSR